MTDVTLTDGIYDCCNIAKWVLIHDGTNVLYKGQCGQATSKNVIVDYTTEALMEAAIITLSLVDLVDEE